ncbi:MAG: 2-C-methyl-D-erythritol 4-phosphate cytidylyltransferase, partial [Thiobacillus sp.]|nr:2-C-methyl-D-erythritol 4-phosphate cytidylyltransferase [Thiobacillus sp.]
MRFYALIPAAGTGTRMGGETPKQYLPLNSIPLIAHALIALAREPRISKLFVVLSPNDAWWDGYEWAGWEDRLQVLRCGGA